MWGCCASRDPKKNKFLTVNDAKLWISDTTEVSTPGDNTFEIEVAYVALNANDRSAIVAQKNIGQSFSGTVKAVGGKLESNDIKKGDKVYGFYTAGGAISDFIIVPAANVSKITGSIDLKTAAALPHIAQVATQLNSTVANGKKVFFSGPKGGLYESIFNGVAKKNTATVQPNADSLVDFLFHSEGNVAVIKPENYTQAWSLDSVTHSAWAEGKKFAGNSYSVQDLAVTSKFAQDAGNSDLLKNIKWSNDEIVSNPITLTAALTKLAATGHGPILVDVDVLKELPKKEEPKPVVTTPPTTDATKTAGQTTVAK